MTYEPIDFEELARKDQFTAEQRLAALKAIAVRRAELLAEEDILVARELDNLSAVERGHRAALQLINMTPHAINIMQEGQPLLTLPASGMTLRCATVRLTKDPVRAYGLSIATATTAYGQVMTGDGTPVPEPQEGVYYIVSALVRLAAPERTDFLSPGPLVRDSNGQPIGCEGLDRS